MPPNQSNAGATLASAAAPASATVRRRVSPAQHDVSTRDNGAGADLSLPEFSPEAVAEHNRPDDCWMIIEGLVYNVTSWVPKHPGGAMIYVQAGCDCTQLFESYHPLYVRKTLGKYLVGRVARPGPDSKAPQVLQFSPDTGFYATLKRRVESYFKEKQINPRVHPQLYAKAALILTGYAVSFYGAYLAPWGMGYAALCALLVGFFTAEIGVSIQHDANHGAFSAIPLLGYILGCTLDLAGASSFMWKQQHVVGHHVHTNVTGFDPDIRVNDPDVRRVTPQQPRRWYHAYQHIYLMALYGLLGIKSVFVDDFAAYMSGSIGPVKLAKMTSQEEVIFWGSKAVYAVYTFGLPALLGNRTLLQFAVLYLLAQFVLGWMLALLFQVAHVVPEAQFPEASSEAAGGAPAVPLSWAALQVSTSTNFGGNSFFWTHVSGGLNHQIEHHLFPGVCHVYYPLIQPIVESTCKEFDVPYHNYPSYWSALQAHLRHLATVGGPPASLHTLG